MTRRVDEFEQPLGGGHYAVRWKDRIPTSLAEQDAEWDRADRLRRQAEERAQRRQQVNA